MFLMVLSGCGVVDVFVRSMSGTTYSSVFFRVCKGVALLTVFNVTISLSRFSEGCKSKMSVADLEKINGINKFSHMHYRVILYNIADVYTEKNTK